MRKRLVGRIGLLPETGGCSAASPLLPYTSEVEAFQRLKRQLAAYRVVFGQPRQEELITLLESTEMDSSELGEWSVELSPP